MKFIRSVIEEMKKVTWPTGKELRKDSLVVIEMSLLYAVIFFIMDTAIQQLFAWILK